MDGKRELGLCAVLVLALGCGNQEGPSPAMDPGAATLARERDALLTELELSGEDRPYLVLDLADSRLSFTMGGVPLRDYPVFDLRRRVPRLGFMGSDSAPAVENTVWRLGRVVPRPRRKVREITPTDPAPEVDEATAPEMPPLPEELLAAPPRFSILFDRSFALEVRAGAEGGTAWRDRFEVLTGRAAPGLSVALSPEDAGALYRSLGDDIGLVIR